MHTPVPRRRIGTSDIEVPVLSLGSWHTYDRMHFADAVTMLRYALHHGITLFDIGVYGTREDPPTFTDVLWGAIVRALGISREEYQVSVKLWTNGFGQKGFRPQLEETFLRTGIEHADLVVLGDLHREDLTLEELVEDLAALTEAGMIRAWGVNNWSASNIRSLQRIATERGVPGPQLAQLKYNVARRSIPDGAPFAQLFADGLSIEASDVLEGGILAGKTTPQRIVGRDPGGIRAAIVDTVPDLVELAAKLHTTPAQLCVAFTLTHPANVSTLVGATRLEQVTEHLGALELIERVGAEELRALVEPFWLDRGVTAKEGP